MTNTFYVLKDEEGVLRPMGFITPTGPSGELRKEQYGSRLEEGQTIVKVTMTEI